MTKSFPIKALKEILAHHHPTFGRVIRKDLNDFNVVKLDFTATNQDLKNINLLDTPSFNTYVFQLLNEAGATVGVGGYNENRVIYRRSSNFDGEEGRSVHLGIDIWTKAQENVYAPLDAKVHSFANNKGFGNYGPTLILEHVLEGRTFYTLFGHLSMKSLERLGTGKSFSKGQQIGEIGDFPENGDWPPHLHFQVIEEMEGHWGDYPGVAAFSEKEKFLANCPDPNLILGIGKLREVNKKR